jgi:hypothetical protein
VTFQTPQQKINNEEKTKPSPGLYLRRQADGIGRYLLEQGLCFLFGWVPTIVGIGLRVIFLPAHAENGWLGGDREWRPFALC